MFVLAYIFISCVVMAFILFYFWKKGKRQSQEFAEVARQLGMSFSRKVDFSFRKRLKIFNRFHSPHNPNRYRTNTFRNMLSERRGDLELVFFECTAAGKSSIGVMEAVFYIKSKALNFPNFCISQMHHIAQIFLSTVDQKDINFAGHPAFSDRYRLTGEDEAAIRRFFNNDLLELLAKLEDNFYIEGRQDQLIICRSCEPDPFSGKRPEARIDPRKFKQLKQQVTQIFQEFFN